jgi:hypothetical protein
MGAPSGVTEKQLRELHLKVVLPPPKAPATMPSAQTQK